MTKRDQPARRVGDVIAELFDDAEFRQKIRQVIDDAEASENAKDAERAAQLRKRFDRFERELPLTHPRHAASMWPPDHTAFERVHGAVYALATSAKSIQQRLIVAAMDLWPLLESDFREDKERDLYRRVRASLWETAEPISGDEGALEASIRVMSDEEAEETAKAIWDLSWSVCAPDEESVA
jgi:hypothetical protein